MDLAYLKKLIKIVSESNLQEIEIEEEGKKVRLTKSANMGSHEHHVAVPVEHSVQFPAASQPAGAPVLSAEPPGLPSPPTPSPALHEIKSPIVGTFYRSPAPDAAPFVQVGSVIEPGMVLCIVEAMKLMNEIEADISGKIVKILVDNGQPIEYDQTLFLVENL